MHPSRVGATTSLSSSLSDHPTESDASSAGADPVVTVLLLLCNKLQWSTHKVAQRLNVPPLVIEEALMHSCSSPLLRAQFSAWAHESNEVPQGVPPALIAAALRFCDHGRYGDDADDDESDASMSKLDPRLRDHFAFLQASVGYNFMSILNNPMDSGVSSSDGASRWSSWLASVVTEAFDYGNPHGAQSSSAISGGTAATVEASAQLLLDYPLSPDIFRPYLDYIGGPLQHRNAAAAAYHTWRQAARTQLHEDLTDIKAPWPHEVPHMFFSPDFSMSELFAQVFGAALEGGGEDLATSGQEALLMTGALEALDVACDDLQRSQLHVENCLFVHVQRKSDDFFSASASFQELHEEASRALQDLTRTREDVLTCGDAVVEEFMSVAVLYRRKHHLSWVAQCIDRVQRQLEAWEYVENWIHTDTRSLELMPAIAAALVKCQGAVLGDEANAALFSELSVSKSLPLRICEGRTMLNMTVSSVATDVILRALNDSVSSSGVEWNLVGSPIDAACTLGCLVAVLQQVQQRIVDELWISSRSAIVAEYDTASAASVAKLAALVPHARDERLKFLAPLKALRPSAYCAAVSRVLQTVQDRVACIAALWEVVQELSLAAWRQHQLHNSNGANENASTPPAFFDSTPFFNVLRVAAHRCVMDMLSVRETENGLLRLQDATPLYRACFQFLAATENILGAHLRSAKATDERPPKKVKGASGGEFRELIHEQCRVVVRRHHEKLQEKVLQAVTTEEQWTPIEFVDATFQDMCTGLCEVSEGSVAAFHKMSIDARIVEGAASRGASSAQVTNPCGAKRLYVMKPATVEELVSEAGGVAHGAGTELHGFVVSHSLLLLVQTLHEYQAMLGTFPFLATEIISRMYDAIKLFDGQCAAMVLGATAVDVGILQAISTQHLALASQCTACLAMLTSLLQDRLRLLFPSDRLSVVIEKDFDRAKRDLTSHKDEFYAKIVATVRQQVDQASAAFDPAQWRQRGNAWVMDMLREMARLIKALRQLLRSTDLKCVMIPIVGHCTWRLREALRTMKPEILVECREQVLSDMHLYKMNTEKFGFSALRCLEIFASPAKIAAEPPHGAPTQPWPSLEEFHREMLKP